MDRNDFLVHCRSGALIGVFIGLWTTWAYKMPMAPWSTFCSLVGVIVSGVFGGLIQTWGAARVGSGLLGIVNGMATGLVVALVAPTGVDPTLFRQIAPDKFIGGFVVMGGFVSTFVELSVKVRRQ